MPTTQYSIEQMDCPTEEQIIRNRLKTIDGVGELEFDLVNRVLTVEHTLDKDDTILSALSFGFPIARTQGLKVAYIRGRMQKNVGADTDNFAVAWSKRF